MSSEGKINWTAIGTVVGFLLLVVTGWAAWDVHKRALEERAQVPARIVSPNRQPGRPDEVVPATEYQPMGPRTPTLISFRNDGKNEALIKQVVLSQWRWKPTPQRQPLGGAGKTVPVNFLPGNYVRQNGQYTLVLKQPAPVPGGGQWTVLEVALVDPRFVGQTFVGRLTIIFDGLEQKHFENVQLDFLKEPPKPRPDIG